MSRLSSRDRPPRRAALLRPGQQIDIDFRMIESRLSEEFVQSLRTLEDALEDAMRRSFNMAEDQGPTVLP